MRSSKLLLTNSAVDTRDTSVSQNPSTWICKPFAPNSSVRVHQTSINSFSLWPSWSDFTEREKCLQHPLSSALFSYASPDCLNEMIQTRTGYICRAFPLLCFFTALPPSSWVSDRPVHFVLCNSTGDLTQFAKLTQQFWARAQFPKLPPIFHFGITPQLRKLKARAETELNFGSHIPNLVSASLFEQFI